MSYAIGLDLGGTNIKGLAVTFNGRVLAEKLAATARIGNLKWVSNVDRVLADLRKAVKSHPAAIGIAAPGLVARDQRSIAFMPERLPGLENLDWQNHFGVAHPVPVLNDAQAALLGEVW